MAEVVITKYNIKLMITVIVVRGSKTHPLVNEDHDVKHAVRDWPVARQKQPYFL